MKWLSIVGDAIVFSPGPLLVVGWVKWLRVSVWPRGWRQSAVAAGLGAASISCFCLYGVVLYLQKAHIGYWNEYLVASRWGRFSWPISLVAFILAVIGKGDSRVLLLLAGSALVLVWTVAFIH